MFRLGLCLGQGYVQVMLFLAQGFVYVQIWLFFRFGFCFALGFVLVQVRVVRERGFQSIFIFQFTFCVMLFLIDGLFMYQFISNLVTTCVEKEAKQPSIEDVKVAILNFVGPILTVRAFKQGGPRVLRSTSLHEFDSATSKLLSFGQIVSLNNPCQPKATHIFMKAKPSAINWDLPLLSCKSEEYKSHFSLPVNSSIGPAIKTAPLNYRHVATKTFNN